jgi:hypothetical protein
MPLVDFRRSGAYITVVQSNMNIFSCSKSKYAIVCTWLLLAASFADYMNLTDLFPDNVTIHSDDDVDTQLAASSKTFLDQFEASAFAEALNSSTMVRTTRNYTSSPIIIDQDSPFLESSLLSSSESIIPMSNQAVSPLLDTPSSRPLHLVNRTLLL